MSYSWVMLGPMVDESLIRKRWLMVKSALDERGRRRWAAAEARSHGRGGIAAVVRATGISESTVTRGIAEIDAGVDPGPGRVRRSGGGRKAILEREPRLQEALLGLLEGATAGDPMSALRWTTLTPERLSVRLADEGITASPSAVRRVLAGMGFTLQANRKSREGVDHPDRDAQFGHINHVVSKAIAAGEPVISVDASCRCRHEVSDADLAGMPTLVSLVGESL